MPVSPEALKGYILEEVLARLIKNSGYSLLVDQIQDPHELRNRHNGLAVIGRGALHQVDVLGQLDWIPAFTFPVRLFLEAKFRTQRTGLYDVRNAVGAIADIRENYVSKQGLRQRYNYNFALFSTSGFTSGAMKMALAHHISLIDLRIPGFLPLLHAISRMAEQIVNNNAMQTANGSLGSLRLTLRSVLGTLPDVALPEAVRGNVELIQAAELLRNAVLEFSELFLGVPNAPFILVLKADDPAAFIQYAEVRPRHGVRIRWSRRIDEGRTWWIEPNVWDVPPHVPAYRLSFSVPEQLLSWIAEQDSPRQGALDAKSRFLSRITIYRVTERGDQLYRLEFDPREIQEQG